MVCETADSVTLSDAVGCFIIAGESLYFSVACLLITDGFLLIAGGCPLNADESFNFTEGYLLSADAYLLTADESL